MFWYFISFSGWHYTRRIILVKRKQSSLDAHSGRSRIETGLIGVGTLHNGVTVDKAGPAEYIDIRTGSLQAASGNAILVCNSLASPLGSSTGSRGRVVKAID